MAVNMDSQPQTKDTKWRLGRASFRPPRFPSEYKNAGGLVPVKATINMEVGEEVVLYVLVSNPLLGRLAKIKQFQLRFNCGVARNEFGPLGFLIFWVPYEKSPENALAIFDLYVNPELITLWMELAHQSHWHVFLLDENDRQLNFWEFSNTFRLAEAIKDITNFCNGVPKLDFNRAKGKFVAETTLDGLHAMLSSSELNSAGESIFDASNLIASPPEFPNPLKSARFAGRIKESIAKHTGSHISAIEYEREKIGTLATELNSKHFVYLDVCHWINLRHVWLQSAKALPVYEKIVDRLNSLSFNQTILCPLSTPIFDELMKQTDPLTRAATANLMEAFSRGICIRNFRDIFCEQWNLYALGTMKPAAKATSVTKVGYWLPEETLKRVFWCPEIENIWEKVAIDLRWHLTVDDYQRLISLGDAAQGEEPPFLARWRGLPEEQKLNRKAYSDLVTSCRQDILNAYSHYLNRDHIDIQTKSAESFIFGNIFGIVPCCEIVAGMCAAQVFKGGKIRENDVHDFIHAAAGIPSCQAYFCDRPMEYLLRRKPLEIESHFNATVRSRPEDLLAYLEAIT